MIPLPILLPKYMCQKPTDLINETIHLKTAIYASLYWLMLQTARGSAFWISTQWNSLVLIAPFRLSDRLCWGSQSTQKLRQRNHLDLQCCENIIRAKSPDAPLLAKPSRTLGVYPSYLEIMLIKAHLHQPSPFMNAHYSDMTLVQDSFGLLAKKINK